MSLLLLFFVVSACRVQRKTWIAVLWFHLKKILAPDCYRWAWWKNISVAKALEQRGWMRGLRRINNEQALTQFVHLWTQLRNICLQPSQPDTIQWRFTADGNFTVKSTYRVQFWGACIPERLGSIWKAKVENKCRFFTWLILQDRLPTADRIIGRGGQANHTCQICKTGVESSFRMIVACSFSLRVWDQIAQHNNFQMAQAPVQPTLTAWWKNLSQSSQTEPKEHI